MTLIDIFKKKTSYFTSDKGHVGVLQTPCCHSIRCCRKWCLSSGFSSNQNDKSIWDYLYESERWIRVWKKLFPKIYHEAATIFWICLERHLLIGWIKASKLSKQHCLCEIGGNATLQKGCAFKVFQKYRLKLYSFSRGGGIISKGVQNVKHARIFSINTRVFDQLLTYFLPWIHLASQQFRVSNDPWK